MGTHPIFESDFDCLTEWLRKRSPFRFTWRPGKQSVGNAERMENYVPGQIESFTRKGKIETFCAAHETTQVEVTDETDVGDTVNLIRTLMVMGEKDAQHLVVMSSVDTLGVHAQIVGEIASQRCAWVYNEQCDWSQVTQWEPISVGDGQSKLDSLKVLRRRPRLVTLLARQPISALKSLYPSRKILFGNATTATKTTTTSARSKKQRQPKSNLNQAANQRRPNAPQAGRKQRKETQ